MKLSRYAAGLLCLLGLTPVFAVSVSHLNITDLQLALGASSPSFPYTLDWNSNSSLIMGTFQGSPEVTASGDASRTSGLLGGDVLSAGGGTGITFGVFTTPDVWTGSTAPDIAGIYSAPSGTVVGDTLTLDLTSLTIFQEDGSGGLLILNQGPFLVGIYPNSDSLPLLTTYDPETEVFTADWASRQINFAGDRIWWHLEGTVTLVPIPAAIWLFSSGLLGLIGVSRYMKKTTRAAVLFAFKGP